MLRFEKTSIQTQTSIGRGECPDYERNLPSPGTPHRGRNPWTAQPVRHLSIFILPKALKGARSAVRFAAFVFLRAFNELQGGAVHAIPQAGRRRAVIEYVSKMTAAAAAVDFRARV